MCGIFGQVSTRKITFDYPTFCTLGVTNDSRGGDSCGVFIDRRVEYGTEKRKLFADFFLGSKLLEETGKCQIALGHCRKASVGTISEKTAQPVVLTNDAGEAEFVVIHNGTIYNYQELAKKYIPEIDITGLTDSQVMTRIFYHAGYQVLDEYNGGAVFVIVDYRSDKPAILFFKGASKNYTTSKDIYEERPLYLTWDKDTNEIVFSSIDIQLYIMRYWLDVIDVPCNQLIMLTDDGPTVVAEYSRANCTQKPQTVVKNTYTTGSYLGGGSYYSLYSDYDDDWSWNKYINLNPKSNTYKINNKLCNGCFNVDNYGYVYSKPVTGQTTEVYFFDGILVMNKACYNALNLMKKQTKLSSVDFYNKFENLIRYLSVDKIYPIGAIWYEATSPLEKVLCDKTWTPPTCRSKYVFAGGKLVGSGWISEYVDLKKMLKSAKLDLSFKEIMKACRSLMK